MGLSKTKNDKVEVETKAEADEVREKRRIGILVELAYNYLNIVDCDRCKNPMVDGFVCYSCGNEF